MAGGVRGGCMVGMLGREGMHGRGGAWHTVNELAVRILLECILVVNMKFLIHVPNEETFNIQDTREVIQWLYGLMKSISYNKNCSIRLRLFEVSSNSKFII